MLWRGADDTTVLYMTGAPPGDLTHPARRLQCSHLLQPRGCHGTASECAGMQHYSFLIRLVSQFCSVIYRRQEIIISLAALRTFLEQYGICSQAKRLTQPHSHVCIDFEVESAYAAGVAGGPAGKCFKSTCARATHENLPVFESCRGAGGSSTPSFSSHDVMTEPPGKRLRDK